MKSVFSTLGACLTLSSLTPAGGGDDPAWAAPFPSPRYSGEGLIAFPSNNVQLLGWLPLAEFPGANTFASDCWGYTSPSGREYAVIGLYHGTAFVEVTDPGKPTLVDFEIRNGSASSWRTVRIYGTYAYACSEGSGTGIQIFDLTNIDQGQVTASAIATANCTTTHTVAVDEVSGFLYRAGGVGGCNGPLGLRIYSLANPAVPTLAGTWNNEYVHECQAVTWDLPGPHFGKQLAFCFMGSGVQNLRILDVTDKGAITVLASSNYVGSSYSHQGWVSAGKQHLYVNDELDDGSFGASRTRIFDISNLASPTYLGFFSSGAGSTDHNLYVHGDRIYEGNYLSGLRVFDNSNPLAPAVIGYFDTYPQNNGLATDGLWSNYPYFASGTILGGDQQKGLFVWRMGAPRLTFVFLGGMPEFVGTGGDPLRFEVHQENLGDLQAGTVQLNYSTDGDTFTTVAATHLGNRLYEAVLPPLSCSGAFYYYVSAQDIDGVTWTDPPAGPTQVHLAQTGYDEIVTLDEDFQLPSGWQFNLAADLTGFLTATGGTWAHVNPIGTGAQPEDDHTPGPSGTLCFATANGPVAGGDGEADIDNGATSLRSPVLDASGAGDPYLHYWRWFSNNAGSAPEEDVMTVEISNDGGGSWVLLETVGPSWPDATGGWIEHVARITDFVTPTSNMLVRFRASDLGAPSIVEAAIDDLLIVGLLCTPPPSVTLSSVAPASGLPEGGNVVTLTGTGFRPGVTRVYFGLRPANTVTVLSSTALEVQVPSAYDQVGPRLGRVERRVDVTVQDPGSFTLLKAYTYGPPRGP